MGVVHRDVKPLKLVLAEADNYVWVKGFLSNFRVCRHADSWLAPLLPRRCTRRAWCTAT